MNARQVPLAFEIGYRAEHSSLTLSGSARNRRDRRPALNASVVGLIGQREQNQLFAGGKVKLPHKRH
jgi:hypothetical protein